MPLSHADRLRTLTFDSPAGSWLLNLWTPAPDLSPAVVRLWSTESQTVAFREKVIPRETVELMVNFGGPQTLHLGEPPQGTKTFSRSWVSGLQVSCLEIESPVAAQLIAASLRPAYAGALFGVAGRELAERVVSLDEIIGGGAEELASRLEESPSAIARFLVFESFLRARMDRIAHRWNPAVCRAINQIVASGGQRPIRRITTELGCSPRYLESRVLEQTGLVPKRLARLIRFSRAVEIVSVPGAAVDWGRVAHACGYYDQSHFNREFRLFTGVTPSAFLSSRDASSQAILVE